ncbi:MAG: sulfatase [Myxococcota bacterium]
MLILASAALAAPATAAVGLARLPFVELTLPVVARPEAGTDIPIRGPFRLVSAVGGVRSYEAPLPIRPRALFYESPPEGMVLLTSQGARLRYAAGEDAPGRAGTWAVTADALTVRLDADAPRPGAGALIFRYPAAQTREDALWPGDAEPETFAVRSVQIDDVTRQGVYLPAPATAAWDVAVPEGGVLGFDLGLVPPEVDDGVASDGADVRVTVDGEEVARARAGEAFTRVEVALGEHAGRTVRLALHTEDGDPTRDHVLIAGPAVYVPSDAPKRVLLVFVDTLRRDHVGLYGHDRDTSPKIDAWAKDAVVFDEARSVAPWTLPSARAALSGLQPEHWASATPLPQRLGEHGFATGAFVGNVYLSSNFEMADGWDEHGCVNWPYGELEVDRALDFLDRHRDRDALLMVHLMDMHLPYKEPRRYRGLFAGDPPAGLGEYFTRNPLLSAAKKNKEAVKRYVLDRYDQNLRYVDDEVARLLAAVGDDAVVVLFADHGEEFFDHGDLEHGHSLYDELLRIPFVVKAPGARAARHDAPVSLLDLAPTVLDLLGLDAEGFHGRSLAPLVRGEPVPADLAGRALAFGRPLYGQEQWGSLAGRVKYTTHKGREAIFDLAGDPGEHQNLRNTTDPAPARLAMAAGLGRAVRQAVRLSPKGGGGTWDVVLEVPGGIETAWAADDPTNKASANVVVRENRAHASFDAGRGAHREVFVVPKGDDPVAALTGAVVHLARASSPRVPLELLPFDGRGEPLAQISQGGRHFEVNWASVPLPAGEAVSGFDPELAEQLKAMGYMEDREDDTDRR